MSRKPESTFIASVHKHLPTELYRLKTHNPYVSGPADMWYSGAQSDLWIEYKYIPHIPKSNKITLALSELQRAWIAGRFKEGRSLFVVLGCKAGAILFKSMDWENTFTQAQLVPRIISRQELADWITKRATGHHANLKTIVKRSDSRKRIL